MEVRRGAEFIQAPQQTLELLAAVEGLQGLGDRSGCSLPLQPLVGGTDLCQGSS